MKITPYDNLPSDTELPRDAELDTGEKWSYPCGDMSVREMMIIHTKEIRTAEKAVLSFSGESWAWNRARQKWERGKVE